ncbi:TolC family protein, partial [Bartonella apis]|uniref:TolC family protein n=1 Tax=Bartonella apis TaxID=1686310 RepID=UPI0024323455
MPHTVNLSLLQKLFVLGTGIIAFSLGFAGCTTTTSQSPRVVRHHPAQPRAQSGQPGLLADAMASVADEHNNSVAKGENGEGLNQQTVTGDAAKSSGNADNDAIAKLQSASGKDGPIKTIGLTGIGIKDAVGVALARHPDIGRANAVVAQGKAQIAIEKSAWYPTLQYSVNPGYNRYYSSSNNKNDPGNVRGTVGASQLIYDFGRTSSRIGAAQATNEKQLHQLAGTMEDVAQNMANTFIELSAAQDLISAAQRETNLLRDTHDKISQRVKAGLSDASDLNQA